ncbi:acyl-CoA thioesterase [Sphingomonas xinjiangensis]|uniref:Acyl-CoA thioester hydrolase n=1 Tax=Sphingomonas xinjiangensis TaxID=643568 RepID=A0A840YTH1_9SPHN|nr:thioesterase family protein [Sphingomonas xinjiangensis]MBB5712923.1 acyl-CoA thioester hydrolase [Sphingomonas xinjiangensis]
MSDASTTTEMLIEVMPRDLNSAGLIDTAAYLRWVQAVVIRHWERFASKAAQDSTLWSAVKHVVSHEAAGRHEDHLVAHTRIKKLKGVRALFITTVTSGEKLLAEIESTWVCLDSSTKLPKALDPEVVRNFL